MTASVTIVTGPPGAGKSSVCAALCAPFTTAVHLETDSFFGAIRSGLVLPWMPESAHQNEVVITAAARSILPYAEGGYEVFVDGIVRPWALDIYRRELAAVSDRLYFVVLMPSVAVCKQRGIGRMDHAIVPEHVYSDMHAQFASDDYECFTLDTSQMTLPDVVETILEQRKRGKFAAST